jgi:hypothetical protein
MNAWGTSWGSAWASSWGAADVPVAVVPVDGPNVYQNGGYLPPRKRTPFEIVIPPELAALMKKSDAQIQYEKRLKKLAPLELL